MNGIALFVMDEADASVGDADKEEDGVASRCSGDRQLPMYYVPPQLAKSRGRGLLERWYVVPGVGKKFCVHAANLSDGSSKVKDSGVIIYVDGTKIHHGWYRMSHGNNSVL